MICPFALEDVGTQCRHRACWMWRRDVDGMCTAQHVGNTTVMVVDVQRIEHASNAGTVARVERGRDLIRHWLAVARAASEPTTGCARCGHAACNEASCHDGAEQIRRFGERVPLADVVPNISAAQVRRAMHAARTRPAALALRELFGRTDARSTVPGAVRTSRGQSTVERSP